MSKEAGTKEALTNRMDIWTMSDDLDDEPVLAETIALDMVDERYGDDGEALYLTGTDSSGRFVEIVIALPARLR